jgi:hypothetical protein
LKDKGYYGSELLNYKFQPVNGGYTVIQVFRDALAYERYMNATKLSPYYKDWIFLENSCQELIGGYIVGLPSEIKLAPTIKSQYPDFI